MGTYEGNFMLENVAICEEHLMKQDTQVVKIPSGESIRREVQATVSLADIGWLAGMITGEGCIGSYMVSNNRSDRPDANIKNGFRVSLTVSGGKLEDLEKARRIIKKLGCTAHVTFAKRRDRKYFVGNLYVAGQANLKRLLPIVLPHLSSKRTEAELLLQIIAYRETITRAGRNGHDANKDQTLLEMMDRLSGLKKEGKISVPPNGHTQRTIKKVQKMLREAETSQMQEVIENLNG